MNRSKDLPAADVPVGYELKKIDANTAVLVKAPEPPQKAKEVKGNVHQPKKPVR
jgi:hypothetical protein